MTRFLAACVAAAAYGAVLDRGRDEHVACATGRPASRARRHLVVATGHVRSIVHAASKLYEHVVAPTRSPVDVVFLVWHDAGYGCEERALAAARDRFNFTVLHDPRECDYFRHRGFHNMANQWWMVHRALGAALALQPGAPGGVDDRGAPGPELLAWAERRYGTIVKARTDVTLDRHIDLDALLAEKAALPEVANANGHFLQVFPCMQGLDVFMVGTPALVAQHFTLLRSLGGRERVGFLEVRVERHGVTPTSWEPHRTAFPFCRGDFNHAFFKLLVDDTKGAPRCAPLFSENAGGVAINRRNPCSPLAARSVSAEQNYCHADFGANATAGGAAAEAALTCPAARPACVGHVHNARWGRCAGRRLLDFQAKRPHALDRETEAPDRDDPAYVARCRAALAAPPPPFLARAGKRAAPDAAPLQMRSYG